MKNIIDKIIGVIETASYYGFYIIGLYLIYLGIECFGRCLETNNVIGAEVGLLAVLFGGFVFISNEVFSVSRKLDKLSELIKVQK